MKALHRGQRDPGDRDHRWLPHSSRKDPADLSDRAVSRERGANRRQQVVGADRGGPNGPERSGRGGRVPPGAHGARALDLTALQRGVEPVQLHPLLPALVGVGVHADDLRGAALDRSRPFVGGRLDLGLDPAGLDRGDRAAAIVHLGDQLECPLLELACERLHVVRAAERVGGRDDAHLVREHLLGAEGERRRVLRGECERLVEAVRVK